MLRRPFSRHARVEKDVQWCVLPAYLVSLGELLQLTQILFSDLTRALLVVGVAEVHSAPEGSLLAGGAESLHLKGATVWPDWLGVGRGISEKDCRFQMAQVQHMPPFSEPTAPPRRIASWPSLRYFCIRRSVDRSHSVGQLRQQWVSG